jgi:hypothetical protein
VLFRSKLAVHSYLVDGSKHYNMRYASTGWHFIMISLGHGEHCSALYAETPGFCHFIN